MRDLFNELIKRQSNGETCILVTVVEKQGECPSSLGKKMLVCEDNNTFGTVGGGALEHYAINMSKKLLLEKGSLLEKYILNEGEIIKDTTTLKMACGGKVSLYYDYIGKKANVYIFGAGHVGQALVNVLKTLNYFITVIDERKEILEAFIGADEKVHSSFTDFIIEKGIKDNSYVIVCTPSHEHDYNVISKVIQLNLKPKYIGMLCSQAKLKTYLKKVTEKFGDDIDLSNFYSPIGLDIGGGSPEEIAISISSEILAVYHNKMGHKHMRDIK